MSTVDSSAAPGAAQRAAPAAGYPCRESGAVPDPTIPDDPRGGSGAGQRRGFTVPSLRGAPGQEWARRALFGRDPDDLSPLGHFRRELQAEGHEQARALHRLADDLMRLVPDAGELGKQLSDLSSATALAASHVGRATDAMNSGATERPFRVALMGRTTAGKSTLFEYLTEGDGEREGDGSQRYSRDVCERPSPILGIELVDTPGVGYSGQKDTPEDYEKAFAEVADADLIVWVASTLATQESTGRALRHLAALGKPVVVALNCSADLGVERNRRRMLAEPERIFGGEALDYLLPIRRYLAQAGADFVAAEPFHAQAALWSRTRNFPSEIADQLSTNSRIDRLVQLLHRERDRRGEQRRAAAQCDRIGARLREAAVVLSDGVADLAATSAAATHAVDAFETRAGRRISDARAQIAASVDDAIQARHKWIDQVDVDGDVNAQWATESQALSTEIQSSVETTLRGLEADLKVIAGDIDDDLTAFDAGQFDGLPGSGEALANLFSKGGIRTLVYGGLAAVDLFPPTAPFAIPATIVVAALDWAFGKQLNKWIDKMFRNKGETTRLRHEKVRDQLGPILDGLRAQAVASCDDALASCASAIQESLDRQRGCVKAINAARTALDGTSDGLVASLSSLDTHLTREFLRLSGRHRLARNAIRATRVPGRAIAVELRQGDHAELALFPVDVVENVAPNAAHPDFPSGAALQVVAGLSPVNILVTTMESLELDVVVPSTIPAGVRDAWATLAFRHTGVRTSIEQGEPV